MPEVTLRDRISFKLFPTRHCPHPEPDAKVTGGGDVIYVDVEMVMDWKDRIRTLLTGRVIVQARVATEFKPGHIKAESSGHILPWKWLARR